PQSVAVPDVARVVVVWTDFVTDLASVPWPFWWLVASYGRHTRAAIVHDSLVGRGARIHVPRKTADHIFLVALEDDADGKHGSYVRHQLTWVAVCLFGRVAPVVARGRGGGGRVRLEAEPVRCAEGRGPAVAGRRDRPAGGRSGRGPRPRAEPARLGRRPLPSARPRPAPRRRSAAAVPPDAHPRVSRPGAACGLHFAAAEPPGSAFRHGPSDP